MGIELYTGQSVMLEQNIQSGFLIFRLFKCINYNCFAIDDNGNCRYLVNIKLINASNKIIRKFSYIAV